MSQLGTDKQATNYGALSTLITVFFFWGFIAAFVTLLAPDMGRLDGIGSFRHFEMMASHGLIFIVILFIKINNLNIGIRFAVLMASNQPEGPNNESATVNCRCCHH